MNAQDFCRLYFRELERQGIAYVLLHPEAGFPSRLVSDVDYAVRASEVPKLAQVQRQLALEQGWRLVYSVQARLYSFFGLVQDPAHPDSFLQLDACGHYVEAGCLVLRDEDLLQDRRRVGEYWVAAPAVEFAYTLAKTLGKNRPLAPRLERLRELWQLEPAGAEEQFQRLFGREAGPLPKGLEQLPLQWEELRAVFFRQHRLGLVDRCREGGRALRRTLRPVGFHLALLGPDGSGKSTLLAGLVPMLEGRFFRRTRRFHFRPQVFESQKNSSPVTNPHGQRPRHPITATAKLLYYFLDCLAGYWTLVFPAKVRSELVVFDRTFDDVLIDPVRYRFRRAGWLAVGLSRLLPRADLTLVLEAAPEKLQARKPELSLEELGRQRAAFQRLVQTTPRCVCISAALPAEEVLQEAYRQVVSLLAAREERRRSG